MLAPQVLVRRPSRRLAEGLVTHIRRRPVDIERAAEQWATYVAAFASAGWLPIEVPPADDCPDSVFVEDTAVVYKDVAVVTRPGADTRRPEVNGVGPVLESLGYSMSHIEDPATLDGGDVMKVGDTIYVGRSGRTNAEGVHQLRAILDPAGATVVAVAVAKVLHLKSAVTALPDGSIIGYPPAVDDRAAFPRFVPVPEASGSHVVDMGDGRLLMAADCSATADLLRGLGYEPVVVDISEFQKLEGGVTCLSVRLRRPTS